MKLGLKDFLTARAVQGEIKGCEEGTLVWLHEKGHLAQRDSPFFVGLYEMLGIYFYPLTAATLVNLLSGPFYVKAYLAAWLIWVTAWLLPEVDAWAYAVRKAFSEGKT